MNRYSGVWERSFVSLGADTGECNIHKWPCLVLSLCAVTLNKHLQLRPALIWWLCRGCIDRETQPMCVCSPKPPPCSPSFPKQWYASLCKNRGQPREERGRSDKLQLCRETGALPSSKASFHVPCQLLPRVGCRCSRITVGLCKASCQSHINHFRLWRNRRPCKGSWRREKCV